LHGVVVPLITPTDPSENVDEAGLRGLIRRLTKAGVHGLFIGGTAGEGPLFPMDQWQRMAEIARDEAKAGGPDLLTGVMDTSSRRIREKIAFLRTGGHTRFVVTPSYYIPSKTASEQLRLFGEAREAAGDMEMVVYNIPQCTGASLSVDTLCEMARRGWIRTCKESCGEFGYLRDLIRRGAEVGLTVLSGDEPSMYEALRMGVVGIVPGCANVIPEPYIRICAAAEKRDWDTVARTFGDCMWMRAPMITGAGSWVSGLKYAASLQGIGSGRALSPSEPVTDAQKREIERLLKDQRVI